MGNIAAWLAAVLPSLALRLLAALGFGVVTFGGLQAVGDTLRDYLIASWAGLPADVLGIVNLAGAGTALNIILSATMVRVTLTVLSSGTRIIGTQ